MREVNGLNDINTIIQNERKLGGVIEANRIKLSSGEEFIFPVITNVDIFCFALHSISFITTEGIRLIVNISNINIIEQPQHKRVFELHNKYYKEIKTKEKIQYLKRLLEVNQNNLTYCINEVKHIINDIGYDLIKEEIKANMELLLNDKKFIRTA